MRARDVRAIAFCAITIVGLLALAMAVARNFIVALAISAAYAAFVLTRPRMMRVYRRLSGEPDWSGYFDNGGGPTSGRGPAAPRANPRPAERR